MASILSSELPWLLLTYSVRMSGEGTTCWGRLATANVRTTFLRFGSMTMTVLLSLFGT